MLAMRICKNLLVPVLVLFALSGNSQVLVNTKIDSLQLFIGEQANLTLSVTLGAKQKLQLPAIKKGDQIITQARHNAQEEAKKARQECASEIKDMVIDAASKISASRHSAEDDAQLYDKFIDKAGALSNE